MSIKMRMFIGIELRNAAIDWFLDCQWQDVSEREEFEELSDNEIIKALNRHYNGGFKQFVLDGDV